MKIRQAVFVATLSVVIHGCGNDGEIGDPAITAVQTYTVTLTDIELVRKGSTSVLAVDGLPVEGATLTRD